jgi:hypothetical protein
VRTGNGRDPETRSLTTLKLFATESPMFLTLHQHETEGAVVEAPTTSKVVRPV